MKKKLTQKSLFQSLEDVIPAIQDTRKKDHTIHSLRDAIFVSFSAAIRNEIRIADCSITYIYTIT